MAKITSAQLSWGVVVLSALTAALAFVTAVSAERSLFFEETASAFWTVPHTCDDNMIVQGTLLVESTRDFDAPEIEDPEPTARLQFQALCPGGISFTWGAPNVPAIIMSTE